MTFDDWFDKYSENMMVTGDIYPHAKAAWAAAGARVPEGLAWRSIKEVMPHLHQHCLVWLDGATLPCIATMNRRHSHTLGSDLINYFALGNGAGDRQLEEVTHWMPLPAGPSMNPLPPKEG